LSYFCFAEKTPNDSSRVKKKPLSALLHRKGGVWRVAELACTEEENPECLSNPAYFSELKKCFPEVSEEIFPKE